YLHRVLVCWSALQQSEKQKFGRQQMDSIRFVAFQRQLDSAAYIRAKSIHTVTGYQFFLDHYNNSKYEMTVIALRDEVAFQKAEDAGTSDAFSEYISRYPNAQQIEKAKQRYEQLLYQEKTSDL